MSTTVSDFLIKGLNEWGTHRIFGFPGDGINGIIGAIGRASDKVDYVQVRHRWCWWKQRREAGKTSAIRMPTWLLAN